METKVLFDCRVGWANGTFGISACLGSGNRTHDPATIKTYTSFRYPDGVILLCQGQVDQHASLWPDAKLTEVEQTLITTTEQNCCHCGKNNDAGITVCWWCGNKP